MPAPNPLNPSCPHCGGVTRKNGDRRYRCTNLACKHSWTVDPKPRGGSKPLGDRALTSKEKAKLYRERQKENGNTENVRRKRKMATIKEWLDESGFDWENGRIIVQPVKGDHGPGWGAPLSSHMAANDDPLLLKEFDDGYGGPECPRFIAEDGAKIYFPSQYDGATAIESIYKDISTYLDYEYKTPYPGRS